MNRPKRLPRYLQIAEAIRGEIEAGRIQPGKSLQPLRDAAERWGVNLHTVRHAYASLAREGLVETARGRRGTQVSGANEGARGPRGMLDLYLGRVMEEARARFGLGPAELASAMSALAGQDGIPTVYVVECSAWQCEGHARELEERFRVSARPWPLDGRAEPPGGPVIATYFHYNEVRRLWPERLREVEFVTISPRPDLADRIPRSAKRVLLFEEDIVTAEAVAADVSTLIRGRGIEVVTRVSTDPRGALTGSRRIPCLFSPRVWARLPERLRAHPRAIEIRYAFDDRELGTLAARMGWRSQVPA